MGRRERGWTPKVRIPVKLRSSWPCFMANFSVQEKDETSPAICFGSLAECLHSPTWWSLRAFWSSDFTLVSRC